MVRMVGEVVRKQGRKRQRGGQVSRQVDCATPLVRRRDSYIMRQETMRPHEISCDSCEESQDMYDSLRQPLIACILLKLPTPFQRLRLSSPTLHPASPRVNLVHGADGDLAWLLQHLQTAPSPLALPLLVSSPHYNQLTTSQSSRGPCP